MDGNPLVAVILPLALGIVMLGLGLTLTLEDFKRVVTYPKPVVVGLLCQMVVLPIVCFAIANAFGLAPELAVGLMLLAASPGGATANLFSHLAKGDVALNVSLTAVNSVLSLLTLPLIVNFAMESFMGAGQFIPMQAGKVVQVFAIVLVPVGLAALAFNLASMAVGYFVPRMLGVAERQAIAIGMEIGIHNGTLAIAIAGPTVLNNSTMAIPPAIYSLIMFFTAAAFGWFVSRRVQSAD